MPRYVYECFECGHTVEKLEGWSAPAQQPCSECEDTLQRIPSAPAIVFKGSGWYSTDSKKSSWKSRRDEDAMATAAPSPKTARRANPNRASARLRQRPPTSRSTTR